MDHQQHRPMLPEPLPTPAGGWPTAFILLAGEPGSSLEDTVWEACDTARRMGREVRADFRGETISAFPHQTTDEVRRTFLGLRPALAMNPCGVRELWIDHRCHVVPHAVWAEFQTMRDLTEKLTEALSRAEVAIRVHGVLNGPRSDRWTAERKEDVLRMIHTGKVSRDEARALYVISPEELLLWEAAYADRGRNGLKITRIQQAGASR
jgi:hypothetical protein